MEWSGLPLSSPCSVAAPVLVADAGAVAEGLTPVVTRVSSGGPLSLDVSMGSGPLPVAVPEALGGHRWV